MFSQIFRKNSGFTVMELAIAVFLSVAILAAIATLAVATVKNSKFTEKLVDTNILLSQKTNQLFNNSVGELTKIPTGQTRAGSIDPNEPINGYFDLLNENGCLIKTAFTSNPDPIIKKSSGTTSDKNIQRLPGDLGDGGGGNEVPTEFNPLDCSTSSAISSNPSTSFTAKFRRQWVVVKDFPSTQDITFSVVIVAIQSNTIIHSNIITKTDGVTTK